MFRCKDQNAVKTLNLNLSKFELSTSSLFREIAIQKKETTKW